MNILDISSFVPALVVLARVLPVVALCPWLGAVGTPGMVRLGLALVIAAWGGWACLGLTQSSSWLPGILLEQLVVGLLLGTASALGSQVALASGRWADLFRGASAEALNPGTGSRESAGGELVSRLILVGMAAGPGLGLTVSLLIRSMKAVPPGTFDLTENTVGLWIRAGSELLGTGFSLAAPVAAATLTVDLAFAATMRVVPALNSVELQAPVRLVLGLGVFFFGASEGAARLGSASMQLFSALALGDSP